VLCSWSRHLTLIVPLSTQLYKWEVANLMLKSLSSHVYSFFFEKMKPSVFSNNNVISTFFKKPKCEFPTILDMLEIKDAVIANCLIDQVMNPQYEVTVSTQNYTLENQGSSFKFQDTKNLTRNLFIS